MTKRIIVVGAGFAGMMSALAAQRLIKMTQQGQQPAEAIEVTVIAPDEKLVVRPRLYEENVADMSAPLGDLFKVTGIQFVQGSVETIDVETQQVASVDAAGMRSTLSYDRLVLAAGSDVVLPSAVAGLSQHSFTVDHLHSAVRLEEHLRNLPSVPATTSGRNTVIVCGGGYTGLELAAELPGRLANIPGLGNDMRVIVIERADVVGPDLSASMRPLILQTLERLGVEVRLGTAVTSIDAGGITTSTGERIETITPIWTAGTVAAPLTRQVPGAKDRSGRLMVDNDLRCPESKAIFAAGDTACARTDELNHDDTVSSPLVPRQYSKMSCQHALPMGRYAGHNAAADLLGLPTLRYSQVMLGTILDMGQGGAIFSAGCGDENDVIALSGAEAKPLKRWINETLIYPPGADDRAAALEAGNPVNRTTVPAGLGC